MELLKDTKLIKSNGKEVVPLDELKDNIVGLYFSAAWCPPCRHFTPLLAKTYTELRKRGAKFQVVFLSSDKNEEEMMQYFRECHGDWLAAAFGQPIVRELQEKFNVTAIPKLIVVNENSEVVTSRGRKEITDRGVGAFRSWSSVSQLQTAGVFNEETKLPQQTPISQTDSMTTSK